jgi:hypothetical protein
VWFYIRLVPTLAILVGLLAGAGAQAEERYRLYSIICVPEIHYFSLRSLDLGSSFGEWLSLPESDANGDGTSKEQFLEEQHGLFSPSRLQADPYACEPIPGIRLEIAATAHPPSTEQCAANGFDAVHITVNGQLLDTLGRINACDPVEDISVVVDDLAYRACATDIPIFPDGPVQSNCRSVPLPNLQHN